MEESVKLFISYSHRDEELRQQLDKHLAPLKRQKVIEAWHDRQIPAGTEWANEIDENLRDADIVLLLVSPDFVASDYCSNTELEIAMSRHQQGAAIIIPVVLEPCDWSWLPFAKFQAFPKDALAVTSWPNQNEAFLDVATGIRKVAQEILAERQAKSRQKEADRETYKAKVEKVLSVSTNGEVSIADRDTLEELRENLGLTATEAQQAEDSAYKPFIDQVEKQEKYKKTLLKYIESYPFSEDIIKQLENRQRDLGLKTEDIEKVAQPVLVEAEKKYQEQLQIKATQPQLEVELLQRSPTQTIIPKTQPLEIEHFLETQGHFGIFAGVNTVAISPDGQTLASGSDDNTIKLWDLATDQEICTLSGHSNSIQSLSFNPEGDILASGSDDSTIKLWDWKNEKEVFTLIGHAKAVKTIAFSSNNDLLASGSDDRTIKLWNWRARQEQFTFIGHSDYVQSLTFTADGQIIISGGWDNMIKFWCCNTHQEILNIDNSNVVKSVAISSDGQTLVTGDRNGEIKLWNLPTGELRQVLTVQKASFTGNGVTSVAISPNGEVIAGATDESKNITLWNLATGEPLQTLSGHFKGVSSVIFSPDGQKLISGSYDRTFRIWY